MPEEEISRRGGALKWRTISLGKNKYRHVAVVRKEGERGGHTVAGPTHKKKLAEKLAKLKKGK